MHVQVAEFVGLPPQAPNDRHKKLALGRWYVSKGVGMFQVPSSPITVTRVILLVVKGVIL